jgi:hypothetical protein
MESEGKAKGGYARAAKLTSEERTAIAQKAATARWDSNKLKLPKATHQGVLKIGEKVMPCAVLDNGTRVISRNAIFKAFGRTKRGRKKDEIRVLNMPSFIDAKNLQPLINKDLQGGLNTIEYESLSGGVVAGYDAKILPLICEVYLTARNEDVLTKSQLPLAVASEMLIRSFAKIGIIALVDEATGYQEVRPKDALQVYLEILVRKELAAWAKKFPDEFYENIYKLKGWAWPGMKKNRFSIVAHYTRDLIYERIAPGLLQELEQKSPQDETGKRKNKLHQWLTEDVGNPMLAQHLHSIIMFQRLALSSGYKWHRFIKMVDSVLPKRGTTLELPNLGELETIEP